MKIKTTLYIQAVKWFMDTDFSMSVGTYKRDTDSTYTVIDIAEQEIEIEVPDVSDSALNEKHIEQLQAMRVQVLADNHMRLQKVDDEIASLLAIDSKAA